MPLCVLDPNTVKREDVVSKHLEGFTPSGIPAPNLAVKYNPDHRWYYYPDMTKDEALLFTQFDQEKGVDNTQSDSRVLTNFHTAFKDPTAPEENLEPRMSCEHRI